MYKHEIPIIPINGCYDSTSSSILTATLLDYQNNNSRSILFNDPLESFFRCKAVTNSPFIEFPIYDLFVGDELKISFEICKISEQPPKYFGCKFRSINGTVLADQDINYINSEEIDYYFKEFEINYTIPPIHLLKDGVLVSLMPVSEIVQCEFALRNVKLEIKTKNSKFKYHENYVRYNNKVEYLKAIKQISNMRINSMLSECEKLYNEGHITLTEQTILFNTTNTSGRWKGLPCFLSGTKYSTPLICYINYSGGTSATTGIYAQQTNLSGNWNTEIRLDYIPQTSTWKKSIFCMTSTVNNTARGEIFNIGRTGSEIQIEIDDIIFAHPRFDAQPYFEPNHIWELYPNLDLPSISKGTTAT